MFFFAHYKHLEPLSFNVSYHSQAESNEKIESEQLFYFHDSAFCDDQQFVKIGAEPRLFLSFFQRENDFDQQEKKKTGNVWPDSARRRPRQV
jgi:hypothetical protein